MSTDPPAKKRKDRPLSTREIRFAQLYVEYGKRGGVRAYLEAGFPAKDTPNATEAAASRTVRKRQVGEYVQHLREVAAAAAQVTVEELAAMLVNHAKADRRKLFDNKGRLLPPDQWPDDIAGCVEGVETDDIFEVTSEPGKPKRKELTGYTRKVKTAARQPAIFKLMEWKRMVGSGAAPSEDQKQQAATPTVIVKRGPEKTPPPATLPEDIEIPAGGDGG